MCNVKEVKFKKYHIYIYTSIKNFSYLVFSPGNGVFPIKNQEDIFQEYFSTLSWKEKKNIIKGKIC